jgi:hypothetical protein
MLFDVLQEITLMKTGTNICPHCSNPVRDLEVDDVHLCVGGQPKWIGMSYGCRSCRKVISVQMNPLTIAHDTAQEVLKLLKR